MMRFISRSGLGVAKSSPALSSALYAVLRLAVAARRLDIGP